MRIHRDVAAVGESQRPQTVERVAEVEIIMPEHSAEACRALSHHPRRIGHARRYVAHGVRHTVRNAEYGELCVERLQ